MFFVYLLASKPHGTLYIGSTSDLVRRVWEHKVKAVPGFTTKYGVDRLVWFERYDTLEAAMQRERRSMSARSCQEEAKDNRVGDINGRVLPRLRAAPHRDRGRPHQPGDRWQRP